MEAYKYMIPTRKTYHIQILRPPSVNTLYGITRGGIKYMTKKGKDWFVENLWDVKRQIPSVETMTYCQVTLHLKTIRMDIDNVLKGTFDLLTQSQIILDDSYIMKLIATKEIVHHKKEEGLDITIEELYEKIKI